MVGQGEHLLFPMNYGGHFHKATSLGKIFITWSIFHHLVNLGLIVSAVIFLHSHTLFLLKFAAMSLALVKTRINM